MAAVFIHSVKEIAVFRPSQIRRIAHILRVAHAFERAVLRVERKRVNAVGVHFIGVAAHQNIALLGALCRGQRRCAQQQRR